MPDYVPITEDETDPRAPATSSLFKRLWKNPLAMFEGAIGAPRLEDAALDSTVTPAGETWVSDRLPASTVGTKFSDVGFQNVGMVALMFSTSSSTLAPGSTRSGSNLRFANCAGEDDNDSAPGSWRCQGELTGTGSASERTTVFVRVA